MKNKLTLILIMFPILGLCQFDYDLFISYESNLEQNKSLLSITEYQLDTVGGKQISAKTYFNRLGLPDSLLQFSSNKVTSKKVLNYKDSKLILIESYKNDSHEASAEFNYNNKNQIISYTDYVYSSYDGEKLLVYYTELTYHPNGNVKQLIKMSNFKKDTIEIAEFSDNKRPIISHQDMSGLRTKKTVYKWNENFSEMKELKYENDTSIYDTIIHRYENDLEIERIDKGTSPKPFYWQYDESGKLKESNQQLFYTETFEYNNKGLLTKKIMRVVPELNYGNFPEKLEFVYTYEERKN